MSHSYSPSYERQDDKYKEKYIQSLEDQVSLHKKHQETHEAQLKGLYARIAHLESLLRAAECSRCYKPCQLGQRMICEDCVEDKYDQPVVFQDKSIEGPACNGCRIRKRKCDRQKPHCSYCIKLHRNQPGLPKCTYPDNRKREWPTDDEPFEATRKRLASEEVSPTSPQQVQFGSAFSPEEINQTNSEA